jgi:hypothetical protein
MTAPSMAAVHDSPVIRHKVTVVISLEGVLLRLLLLCKNSCVRVRIPFPCVIELQHVRSHDVLSWCVSLPMLVRTETLSKMGVQSLNVLFRGLFTVGYMQ